MKTPRQILKDVNDVLHLPAITIDLMNAETKRNDVFYERTVREFYDKSRKRHRKFPLIRALQYGVAVCELPSSFDDYFRTIEASARRNFKKAERLGYEFRRIDYNRFLDDVSAIRRSANVRQGKMPEELLSGEVEPCKDPASHTEVHDYAYFGVLKEGCLLAYAGCLVSGEVFMIEQLYGHAAHQTDGIVPMLIIEIARYIPGHYPRVKYCVYGSYFGAGTTLRRFKRKFGFVPCRVTWLLNGVARDAGD